MMVHVCVCVCVCACVCVCGEMYLLKSLPAGVVGLAMVAMCTYRADCIPWADRAETVAVSLHEGYEMNFVNREHSVYQGC